MKELLIGVVFVLVATLIVAASVFWTLNTYSQCRNNGDSVSYCLRVLS